MPPDAARRLDTLAWLRKAEGDLRLARIDLTAEPPSLPEATDALALAREAHAAVLAAVDERLF